MNVEQLADLSALKHDELRHEVFAELGSLRDSVENTRQLLASTSDKVPDQNALTEDAWTQLAQKVEAKVYGDMQELILGT